MYSNISQDQMISLLEKFRNIPFVPNGRSLSEGIDCLGFMILFYKEFGIHLPDGDGFPVGANWFREDPDRYVRGIQSLGGRPIPIDELQTLDLVYFALSRNTVTHSGVMVSPTEFAHVMYGKGFSVTPLRGYWARKWRGAVRLVD